MDVAGNQSFQDLPAKGGDGTSGGGGRKQQRRNEQIQHTTTGGNHNSTGKRSDRGETRATDTPTPTQPISNKPRSKEQKKRHTQQGPPTPIRLRMSNYNYYEPLEDFEETHILEETGEAEGWCQQREDRELGRMIDLSAALASPCTGRVNKQSMLKFAEASIHEGSHAYGMAEAIRVAGDYEIRPERIESDTQFVLNHESVHRASEAKWKENIHARLNVRGPLVV